jgi:CheY-like chemotaxis protein
MTTATGPIEVPKVLVVEDEMVLRMRAADIVEDAGFCPVEAVNADEAIAILESRSDIALLFTDIQMPGRFEVGPCRARALARHQDCPGLRSGETFRRRKADR